MTGMTMRIEYLFLLTLLTVPIITTVPSVVFASTDEDDSPGEGDDQRDRVGNPDDEDDSGVIEDDEVKDRDGPDDDDDDPDGKEANCWGEVTRDFAQTGSLGEHSSDPPGDDDNPREGVGNQDEDHPSDHADTVGDGISDADCVDED
jgi:hypothetical protein